MISVTLLVFATCSMLATAGIVPFKNVIANFNSSENLDFRYSNNVQEDARLIVPDLIKKYGYPVEIHHVVTKDGYILEMHRIPHGRNRNNATNKSKPIVFLQHGLLCSSSVWVLSGPGSGFGYILAEEGYDVWMGNIRGNRYSRRHIRLNPDALLSTAFWRYSWDEHGNYDLPAMIDYALAHTGKDRLHYIGHSMGTTMFFAMGSLRPQYNDKIISMHALAPVAYMAHNRNLFLNAIAPFSNNIERIGAIMGYGEFLTSRQVHVWAGEKFCKDEAVFQPICTNILFLLGGWNEAQHNATIMPIIFGHVPAGGSVRQLAHYGQGISGNEFRRYDQGNALANLRVYGRVTAPRYDLSKVTAPVFLHYSDNDGLAEIPDVRRLFRELGKPIGMFRVPLPEFTHVNFIFAVNVRELLYDRVIRLMKQMDNSGLGNIDSS